LGLSVTLFFLEKPVIFDPSGRSSQLFLSKIPEVMIPRACLQSSLLHNTQDVSDLFPCLNRCDFRDLLSTGYISNFSPVRPRPAPFFLLGFSLCDGRSRMLASARGSEFFLCLKQTFFLTSAIRSWSPPFPLFFHILRLLFSDAPRQTRPAWSPDFVSLATNTRGPSRDGPPPHCAPTCRIDFCPGPAPTPDMMHAQVC